MPRASRFCSSVDVLRAAKISASDGPLDAIVVLGCRVVEGRPGTALERRLRAALRIHKAIPEVPIILSGGKSWDGFQESVVMTTWWREQGSRSAKLHAENESLTTRENALRVAELCARLGYRHIALVTCDFHMQRAGRLFARERLVVTPVPANSRLSRVGRFRLRLREWGASILGEVDSWIR